MLTYSSSLVLMNWIYIFYASWTSLTLSCALGCMQYLKFKAASHTACTRDESLNISRKFQSRESLTRSQSSLFDDVISCALFWVWGAHCVEKRWGFFTIQIIKLLWASNVNVKRRLLNIWRMTRKSARKMDVEEWEWERLHHHHCCDFSQTDLMRISWIASGLNGFLTKNANIWCTLVQCCCFSSADEKDVENLIIVLIMEACWSYDDDGESLTCWDKKFWRLTVRTPAHTLRQRKWNDETRSNANHLEWCVYIERIYTRNKSNIYTKYAINQFLFDDWAILKIGKLCLLASASVSCVLVFTIYFHHHSTSPCGFVWLFIIR